MKGGNDPTGSSSGVYEVPDIVPEFVSELK